MCNGKENSKTTVINCMALVPYKHHIQNTEVTSVCSFIDKNKNALCGPVIYYFFFLHF